MTIAELHFHFLNSNGVCTDTRSLQKNQIYISLKGDNFNGNKFAKQALLDGARLAVIDEKEYEDDYTVLVDNALKTLQQLANYHRNYLNLPIIGLTGSNGKTTTKELINAVLSEKYVTVATKGNLNNHIGVPLTLLSMDTTTEIGIVEMGANHQGEIAMLCEIAQPNFGYITNFGKAHLEGFGGFEGVIKGKSELYNYLRDNEEMAFINDTDKLQVEKATGITLQTFGSTESNYPISLVNGSESLKLSFKETAINSQLIGIYNYTNIAVAIAMGTYFDLSIDQVKSGIEKYIPANNRSQIIKKDSYSIILDAYNANPTSMAAALENLKTTTTTTIAFIGNMFEVGVTSKAEHQAMLDLAHHLRIDQVYAIGPDFGTLAPHVNQEVYEDYNAFAKAYSNKIPTGATVLIKGSRGMKMERILNLLEN
ncbi:UDP-N-acetylmuramoyl-tripeptide--D-alanyl-D-alanine ligase [Dokdonia sp. Dokd-P16]|uniref:UDP-N-acetylmuramoyl-tripeptide--D-alanyl-D- alanine ligase n=1 Tax=Dokdonia sp. Dokd-P16 TaxID=2173169 RepID=UPI000D547E92|nr:UDP-N-acetylmuramoyl-tripeptide--D-alanyl-D-alanine ligase [Dokdonia sp. Dokd-P16]AWH74322.1 UDP-N-acetylmuramoyl-tripeptide--D-alanyl-D-alanine ligase [Dokdonia sp. Dokd-P16]